MVYCGRIVIDSSAAAAADAADDDNCSFFFMFHLFLYRPICLSLEKSRLFVCLFIRLSLVVCVSVIFY